MQRTTSARRTLKSSIEKIAFCSSQADPMRDYQFLRTLLYRDRSTALDVLLQSGKEGMSQEGNILSHFPNSREEMFQYDCVVAFDPDWQALKSEQIALMENWGGGAGGRFDCRRGSRVRRPDRSPVGRKTPRWRRYAIYIRLNFPDASRDWNRTPIRPMKRFHWNSHAKDLRPISFGSAIRHLRDVKRGRHSPAYTVFVRFGARNRVRPSMPAFSTRNSASQKNCRSTSRDNFTDPGAFFISAAVKCGDCDPRKKNTSSNFTRS